MRPMKRDNENQNGISTAENQKLHRYLTKFLIKSISCIFQMSNAKYFYIVLLDVVFVVVFYIFILQAKYLKTIDVIIISLFQNIHLQFIKG